MRLAGTEPLSQSTSSELTREDFRTVCSEVGIIDCTPDPGQIVDTCCSSYVWSSFPGGDRLQQIQVTSNAAYVQISASQVLPGGTRHCEAWLLMLSSFDLPTGGALTALATGSDVIHLIASTGTCGVDAAVGGMSYTATGSPPALTFALGKLVSSTYKVCHCPSVDGADVDSTACSSADEFTNEAGQLDVEGVAWLLIGHASR
eukprot:s1728_g3.t1